MTDLLDRRDGLMLGHLQRLPGADQAGPGALRQDCGHRRHLPHPDLQHHRPPPVPAGAHPGGLRPFPLAEARAGGRACTPCPFPMARAGSWPRRRSSPVWRQTARSPPSMWICRIGPRTRFCSIPTAPLAPSRALLSPDGRVLGKMGHSERIGSGLYRNVPGEYDMQLFRSAVEYFK